MNLGSVCSSIGGFTSWETVVVACKDAFEPWTGAKRVARVLMDLRLCLALLRRAWRCEAFLRACWRAASTPSGHRTRREQCHLVMRETWCLLSGAIDAVWQAVIYQPASSAVVNDSKFPRKIAEAWLGSRRKEKRLVRCRSREPLSSQTRRNACSTTDPSIASRRTLRASCSDSSKERCL